MGIPTVAINDMLRDYSRADRKSHCFQVIFKGGDTGWPSKIHGVREHSSTFVEDRMEFDISVLREVKWRDKHVQNNFIDPTIHILGIEHGATTELPQHVP